MARIIKGRQMTARYWKGREVLKEYKLGRLVYEKQTAIPDYLCFTALEAGTFTLTVPAAVTSTYLSYVEYSLDGRNWTKTNNTSSDVTITTPSVTPGDKVYWRGKGSRMSTSTTVYSNFAATGNFDASGNILSLLFEDNFASATAFSYDYPLGGLFNGNTKLIHASGITMPSFANRAGSFANLFANCTNVVSVPNLLITEIFSSVLYGFCDGCTSLASLPTISATTMIGRYGCYRMFRNCTSITGAVSINIQLNPIGVADNQQGFQEMFAGCTGITSATITTTGVSPLLFEGCFSGCSALATINYVTPTTSAERMFRNMCRNCTSLTKAFDINATTLATQSCQGMFYGCTSLNYVKCLATDISATNCTDTWLYNVSSTGTFIQAAGVTWPRGASGIPTGWLAYDEGEEIPNDYTPCDYIYNSSTGANGVDLGFVFSTKNNTLEVKFKQDEISNGMPCGSRDNDGRIWFYNYEAQNKFAISIKPVAVAQFIFYAYSPLDTDTHIVKYVGDGDDQYYYHNETLIGHGTRTDLSDTCPYNLFIFGRPANGYKGRIYYLKVWNTATEEVICNLIPCSRNSDGAAGFWDTAQKQFFTSTYWTAHNETT